MIREEKEKRCGKRKTDETRISVLPDKDDFWPKRNSPVTVKNPEEAIYERIDEDRKRI